MVERRFEAFLTERLKLREVAHSGRDFYTHLKGTHDILRDWGQPEHICRAGLFHSIYGTKFFRHAAMPIEQRAEVRALIGPEAERLAYLFCISDRLDQFRTLPYPLRPELVQIERANLLEQGGARHVSAPDMRVEFDRCWPWLAETLKRNPTHTKDQLWQRLEDRRTFLWPGKGCVLVGEINTYPSGLKVGHVWLTGPEGELDEILSFQATLENFARLNGCHRATILGRRGWLRRAVGFREFGACLGKEL